MDAWPVVGMAVHLVGSRVETMVVLVLMTADESVAW